MRWCDWFSLESVSVGLSSLSYAEILNEKPFLLSNTIYFFLLAEQYWSCAINTPDCYFVYLTSDRTNFSLFALKSFYCYFGSTYFEIFTFLARATRISKTIKAAIAKDLLNDSSPVCDLYDLEGLRNRFNEVTYYLKSMQKQSKFWDIMAYKL
jgi:hypothetical protein